MDHSFYYNALAQETNGDYGSLKKLSDFCDGDWEAGYQKYKENNPIVHDPAKEWERLESSGVRLVLLGTPGYPPLLKEISHPPLGLYVRGKLPLNEISIAIVGTRKATNDGKTTTRLFANVLAKSGFVIISGLAFGIDASAHEGCLDAGGATIAVLASGVDTVSPRTNIKLAKRILDGGGAIVSEYPLGSVPVSYRFIERNRIISGLSKGVLVIEAPESSGALATVRFSIEENRDVFIVPGPIAHPNFVGSHNLIRNGAELVTKPEHIMEAYGIIQECARCEENLNGSPSQILSDKIWEGKPEEKLVLNALRENTIGADVDKIIAMTKLEPRTVNQTLSFLLIRGMIKETENGYAIK